jgi:hypothetical protein
MADTEIAEPPPQAAPPVDAEPQAAPASDTKVHAVPPSEAKLKQAKASKQGKEPKKKPKRANSDAAEGGGLSIAAHPRAARGVARAKGWGGLVGFMVGGYLALPTNTLAGTGLHALIAGVACYTIVWAGAVFLWRHLVVAELRTRQQQMLQAELAKLQGANPAVSQGPVNLAERSRAGASW